MGVNFFTLTLDTTGPAGTTLTIDGGSTYATTLMVNVALTTTDTDKYQMKIWGNVDTANDTNIKDTEVASSWITYENPKQVKLASGDGSKSIFGKIRDDVYNESSQATDTIILDTTLPGITLTGPDVPKISKIAGKNVCTFSFYSDTIFDEYKVKVVGSTSAAQDTGVQMTTAGGSTNMSGVAGNYPASTPISCTINGADLESVSAGDGAKIIKIFVKDQAGQWCA